MTSLFDKIFPMAKFVTFPNAPCVPRKPLSKEILDSNSLQDLIYAVLPMRSIPVIS